MSAPNLHETHILLTAMRNAGYRVRLNPVGDLSVGPAAMISDFERAIIADHRDNLLKILQGERAAAEILIETRIDLDEFDARPAMYRSKWQVTELGSALGYTQGDFVDAKKGGMA